MPLDTSIPLQARMAQFNYDVSQPANILATAMKLKQLEQEGELNALTIRERKGVQKYLSSRPDLKSPEARYRLATEFGETGRKLAAGVTDIGKAETEEAKRRAELVTTKTAQYRDALAGVNDQRSALQWIQMQQQDPDMAGSPVSKGSIMDAARSIPADPAGFAQWKQQAALGMTKWIELNKPHYITENLGGTSRVTAVPGLGGAPTTVSTTKKTMTPGEAEANAIARERLAQEATGVVYQEDANGNIVALPSRLKAGQVPVARTAVAPGGGFQPLAAKPSEAVGKELMSINQQKSIVQGAIDAAKATPSAFGWETSKMPESLRARWAESAENENRAFVFNVVSGVIKERAGTAQSAAEKETLERFLPVETDNASIIQDKLRGFQKYLAAKEAGTTKKKTPGSGNDLSAMDKAALDWANANPSDPRATQIRQRLGM